MRFLAIPSLRWRLVAVMCLAYLAVTVATQILSYKQQESTLHSQLETRATVDARILAAAGASALLPQSPGETAQAEMALQNVVTALQHAQGVSRALVVYGNHRVVVASTRSNDVGGLASLPLEAKPTARLLRNGDVQGIAPIAAQGTALGLAEVILSDASIQQELRDSIRQNLLVSSLGLLIFILLSLVISQRILSPLERLSEASRALRRGEFSSRADVHDGTELGTLAETFNSMATSLEQRINHLSFLARAGAVLPNRFRTHGDIEPILAELCQQLGLCGAALTRDDDPTSSIVHHSVDSNDVGWQSAAMSLAAKATTPATGMVSGLAVMAVPTMGDLVFITARKSGRPFTSEERTVITNFAHQIGISADNARLLEEQQEALQVKDQFLSIVSHELRTPLTTIKGYAQMLRRKLEGDPTGERFADNIDAQVSRLSRLVDDLLDVTRFARGQFDLLPKPMDIRPVLEEVVARFRLVSPKHTFRLHIDRGPSEGCWDHDRLEQVMNNLVGNAVKYSPDGGLISITTSYRGDTLTVSVRDEGVGISRKDQAQLFQRFYRGTGEGQDVKGLGLGLYVSRRIIEAHGGAIWVSSQPGQGSEFSFSLPLTPQLAPQPVPS